MKHILLLFVFALFWNSSTSQNFSSLQRIVVVAEVDNGVPNINSAIESGLNIKGKVNRIFNLNTLDFELINPLITNEAGKGWFIQFEFDTPKYAGVYKEQLILKDNQLIITENREAKMAIATNCNTIVFTNTNDRSKCSEKKNENLDSETTYRLFFSAN